MDNRKQLQKIKELREKAEELLNIANEIEGSVKPFDVSIAEALLKAFGDTGSIRSNGNLFGFFSDNWDVTHNTLAMITDDFSFSITGEVYDELLNITRDYEKEEYDLVREVKKFIRSIANIEVGNMFKHLMYLKVKCSNSNGLLELKKAKLDKLAEVIIDRDIPLKWASESVKQAFDVWKTDNGNVSFRHCNPIVFINPRGFSLETKNINGKTLIIEFDLSVIKNTLMRLPNPTQFILSYTLGSLRAKEEDIKRYLYGMVSGDTITLDLKIDIE